MMSFLAIIGLVFVAVISIADIIQCLKKKPTQKNNAPIKKQAA